jgi:D-alanyl-D-alanine carboxypeptidase (penicillin-binding protein 5/6)
MLLKSSPRPSHTAVPARLPVLRLTLLLGALTTLCALLSTSTAAAPVPAPPSLKATAWLLVDHHSGAILAEHNADERVEPASLTKILTTFVVFSELRAGKIALEDEVLISKKAWKMPGSKMFVEVDRRVSVHDLIRGVVIQSGNDASVALAEHVAGSESAFADLMNQYAERVGMVGSHFVNASGLPHADHYTTALDMSRLAVEMIRAFPGYYSIHAQKEFEFNDIKQSNRNKLLWIDDSVDGIKTGHTENAGYCLVASARREDMRLVSVLMGAESERARTQQSRELLGYGFRFFETHRLYAAASPIRELRVYKGERERVAVGLKEDLFVTVPRGQYDRLVPLMEVQSRIEAPVIEGDVRGELRLELDGDVLVRRPLSALETVRQGSMWQRLTDSVRMLLE